MRVSIKIEKNGDIVIKGLTKSELNDFAVRASLYNHQSVNEGCMDYVKDKESSKHYREERLAEAAKYEAFHCTLTDVLEAATSEYKAQAIKTKIRDARRSLEMEIKSDKPFLMTSGKVSIPKDDFDVLMLYKQLEYIHRAKAQEKQSNEFPIEDMGKQAAKNAKEKWGVGFERLSIHQQRAEIAMQVMELIGKSKTDDYGKTVEVMKVACMEIQSAFMF